MRLAIALLDALSRCHTSTTWSAKANELLAPYRVRMVGDEVRLVGDPGDERAELETVLTASWRHVRVARRAGEVSHRAHARLRELGSTTPAIVAESPSMRAVVETLPAISGHAVSVLLLGESGVGKELIARTIHGLSPRARLPFVAVNCGALPPGLVESVLFGHERGAFTDATRRAIGFFEKAHHGTLFLDEIGELPRAAQAKLLRAVEQGEITRIGGDTIRVDVRIIAATNRELERSDFRRDLFYRLATCVVRIPALRDRPSDIPVLARAILEREAAALRIPTPRLSRGALAKLRRHRWPGNVRELQNAITRALVLHDDGPLEIEITEQPSSGVETWREGSKRVIGAALRACEGRIYGAKGAAARLGLKPTTLQSKMRKLGIRKY